MLKIIDWQAAVERYVSGAEMSKEEIEEFRQYISTSTWLDAVKQRRKNEQRPFINKLVADLNSGPDKLEAVCAALAFLLMDKLA